MGEQDVILLLLPVQLHDDREHKQVNARPSIDSFTYLLMIKIF